MELYEEKFEMLNLNNQVIVIKIESLLRKIVKKVLKNQHHLILGKLNNNCYVGSG